MALNEMTVNEMTVNEMTVNEIIVKNKMTLYKWVYIKSPIQNEDRKNVFKKWQ